VNIIVLLGGLSGSDIQYVPGLSLPTRGKKIIFDFTQKLQRNNIACFI
jgi:hypothetical protein